MTQESIGNACFTPLILFLEKRSVVRTLCGAELRVAALLDHISRQRRLPETSSCDWSRLDELELELNFQHN